MKNVFLILSLFLLCAHNLNGQEALPEKKNSETQSKKSTSLIAKYLRSIIPGLLVGGTLGGITGLCDRQFPKAWPLFWVFSFYQRMMIIHQISHDMKEHNLPHHQLLMENSSFISSWLLYYLIYLRLDPAL